MKRGSLTSRQRPLARTYGFEVVQQRGRNILDEGCGRRRGGCEGRALRCHSCCRSSLFWRKEGFMGAAGRWVVVGRLWGWGLRKD